jgi:hypothetical protein
MAMVVTTQVAVMIRWGMHTVFLVLVPTILIANGHGIAVVIVFPTIDLTTTPLIP